MLTFLQRLILFPCHQIPVPPVSSIPPDGFRLDVEHSEGLSEGWLLPGGGVSKVEPGPLVIFAHGNGELIDHWPAAMAMYRRRGISVAMLEYRGYGRSDGAPTESGIVADLVAFYDALVGRAEVDAQRVFFHGRSLGGGAVCGLSRQREPRALVLESTFRSVRVLARSFLLPGFLVSDPFDNEAALAELEAPCLLFHGRGDQLVPFEHARALERCARDGRLVAFDCGHNNLPQGSDVYQRALDEHLARSGVLV